MEQHKTLLERELAAAIADVTYHHGMDLSEATVMDIAIGLVNSPNASVLVALQLEQFVRNPTFVQRVTRAATDSSLDDMHLDDVIVAYENVVDVLAAAVNELKRFARE